ncbi:hypothetical protein BASA81_009141 [Batrachochytrium salamandrivorans]|nr:hypothetical protein BASA81_009141 [Batrachochytrium salamandrivorans]
MSQAASTASAIKARLSAKKPAQCFPLSFSEPYPIHLFHPSPLKQTPPASTKVLSPPCCAKSKEDGLEEASYKLARSLIGTDKPQARRVLNKLAKDRAAVISTAAFWAVCLEVESGNAKRTATCFLLAIKNCTSAQERQVLVDSLLVDYFEAQTVVLASPAKFQAVSPEQVQSVGSLLEKLHLLEGEEEQPFCNTAVVATAMVVRQEERQEDDAPNHEWWQQPEVTTTPLKPAPTKSVFFSSPAARVCTTPVTNRRRLSTGARLTPAPASTPTTGLVVVLSPVRESRKSDTKVATPVRRSTRTNHIASVESKNRTSLLECGFAYTPNASLSLSSERSPEPQQPARRSQRKTKEIVRFQ